MKNFLFFVCVLCSGASAFADVSQGVIDRDLRVLEQTIRSLDLSMQEFRTEVLPIIEHTNRDQNHLFSLSEAASLRRFWTSFFDVRTAFHGLYSTYNKETNPTPDIALIRYACALFLLTSAAEVVEAAWDNPLMRKELNQTDRANVPEGTFLSMQSEVFFYDLPPRKDSPEKTLFPVYPIQDEKAALLHSRGSSLSDPDQVEVIKQLTQQEEAFLQKYDAFIHSAGHAFVADMRAVLDGLKGFVMRWFTPIITWLGDTKVKRSDPSLHYGLTYITKEAAEEFTKRLLPGDMIFARGNWYLSNAFLPGFWPHNILYLGTPGELSDFFDHDPSVAEYFTRLCATEALPCFSFSTYLAFSDNTKKGWTAYLVPDTNGDPKINLEAQSEGVVFSSIHFLMADYLGAVRPRVTKLSAALAIAQAFKKFGYPYDFLFDFQTEDKIVCSELLVKSYRPDLATQKEGVNFDYDLAKGEYFEKRLGLITLPTNKMIQKIYDENVRGARPPELDFVAFLQSDFKNKTAVFSSEQSFYASKDWPKWSFVLEKQRDSAEQK